MGPPLEVSGTLLFVVKVKKSVASPTTLRSV